MTDSNDMEQISATIILEAIASGKLNTAFPKLLGRYGQVCINDIIYIEQLDYDRLICIFPLPED